MKIPHQQFTTNLLFEGCGSCVAEACATEAEDLAAVPRAPRGPSGRPGVWGTFTAKKTLRGAVQREVFLRSPVF